MLTARPKIIGVILDIIHIDGKRLDFDHSIAVAYRTWAMVYVVRSAVIGEQTAFGSADLAIDEARLCVKTSVRRRLAHCGGPINPGGVQQTS
jgi:hypothetical protein